MAVEISVEYKACLDCPLVKEAIREAKGLSAQKIVNPKLDSIFFGCGVNRYKETAILSPYARYRGSFLKGTPDYRTRAVPDTSGECPWFCPKKNLDQK